jgi:hypothetical protein
VEDELNVNAGETASAYAPRPVVFYGVEELAGWPVKVYGIAVTAAEARPELVNATRERARVVLAETGEGDGPSAAFVIAHDAWPACFALVHWWRGVDLYQRYYRSPLERPTELELTETGRVGCVWELEVVAYEREAWLRHVVAPTEPDVAAYLVDRLEC